MINGIRVPRDPGNANNLTIQGIDSDRNGIRDDIDRFIAQNFWNQPEKMKQAITSAKIQFANYQWQTPTTRLEAETIVKARFKNYECFEKEFGIRESIESKIPQLIEQLYLNSEIRYAFSRRMNELARGVAIAFESNSTNLCTMGIK